MAVIRQQNWLGQQRVDVDHLRAVESGVAGDMDLLAGTIIAGKAPLITSGFQIIATGVTLASALKIRTADSTLIHFLASESGSVFHVPADRADETLNSVNTRISGSFTTSAINYVGVDLVRSADTSTTDLVEFLDTDTLVEKAKLVPLARTLDYKIVISTTDFEGMPGVCPIARVDVDSNGQINEVADARSIAWRLGSGGTSPNPQNQFSWPAGRKEGVVGVDFGGGDKAITSFKGWMDAVMTRIWEVGGGEFWYSSVQDHNVIMARTGTPFVSSGEFFEWSGTNLHWKGLVILFSNSTGTFNEIFDVTSDTPGTTDLADGECIYVDIDRSLTRTVAGPANALHAVKVALTTLGSPSTPGSRWVLAWRKGSSIYVRDQSYAVGSAFKLATTAAAGMVELNALDPGSANPPQVVTFDTSTDKAIAAGMTRGTGGNFGGAGDIEIGGGPDDNQISMFPKTGNDLEVQVSNNYGTTALGAITAVNSDSFITHAKNIALRTRGFNSGTSAFESAQEFECGGAVGMRNVLSTPATPAPTAFANIRVKYFIRDNGIASPHKRDQYCIIWWDGSVTVVAESPEY